MILRHPGISPTNDLVAKKIFSNPEITCQFIRDMLDLPAKNEEHLFLTCYKIKEQTRKLAAGCT